MPSSRRSTMTPLLALLLIAASSTAGAVVIRHDVDDAAYRIPASAFPALVDMPGEGHGVLVAPQWVLTAGHVVSGPCTDVVTINGLPREVERVVMHPGYAKTPQSLVDDTLATGDPSRLLAFLAASDDIALVRLAAPVDDVAPVALYRGKDETGKTVEIVGKGATGHGIDGQALHAPHRTELRRAFNTVTGADARWLSYVFDAPPAGLPLEGIIGNGDSGGPVIIDDDGQRWLAGLASWSDYEPSDVRPFHAGRYEQIVYSVRVSRYVEWIEGVMSGAISRLDDTSR